MKKMVKNSLFFLVLSLFIFNAFARDNIFPHIHQPYIGVRPMAMGGAFTAVGGDYNALFYNPAALYELKNKHLIVNIGKYSTSTGDEAPKKLFRELRAAGNKEGNSRTSELTNLITNKYGKHYFGRLSLLNIFSMRPEEAFAFIPLDTTLRIRVDKQVGPTISLQVINDTTVAWGKGFNLDAIKKGLRLGTTFKLMYRAAFQRVVPILEYERNSELFKSDYAQEGLGIDMDLGGLYRLGEAFWGIKPSIGFNIRNFFKMGFKENVQLISDKTSNPPDQQQRFDFGGALEFPSLWVFTPTLSADMRDLGHENFSLKKGYHLGTEWKFKFGRHLHGGLMAGLNQGYLTYGISLQGLWYLFEYASYGEEIGTSEANTENRVNMMKLALFF